ncbi:MAG: hypothetical protein JOZ12_02700 [Sinobacteraceae bacterium]|nr:hypothetical protein [Nevskiaceae bacterium]MBV9913669.1 hypothetical protein [Nevskiaceae bacterium]
MAALTEWLQLMLAEIARKREERERAGEEELRRRAESARADFTQSGAHAVQTDGGKRD